MAFDAGTVSITAEGNIIPLKRDMLAAKRLTEKNASAMQGALSGVQVASRKMSTVMLGSFGAIAGAAGIGLVIRSVVQMGAEFEQSMATVRGVMRASHKEFKNLTAIAKRMGETTEWTASQAAKALQFLGMAGFEAEKAIKALPGTLDLATAGQIELGRAADIASNALTAFQLEAEELNRVNDVFVATITRSNTNIEMMADSFRYAAPKAKAYGYSIERLSALIGTLGNAGIQGSMAGTQLSFALGKVDKAAAELGLGPGVDLLDVLDEMKRRGWDAAQIMNVFGERGGRAALVLKDLVPKVRELEAANMAAEGEAKRLADTMRSTVIGRFRELKSVIESVAIDAFTEKQSKLGKAIQGITQVVRDNKDAFIGLATSIVNLVADGAKLIKWFADVNKESKKYVTWLDKIQEAGGRLASPFTQAMRVGTEDALKNQLTLTNRLISSIRDLVKENGTNYEYERQLKGLLSEKAKLESALNKIYEERRRQHLLKTPIGQLRSEDFDQPIEVFPRKPPKLTDRQQREKDTLENLKKEAKALDINIAKYETIEELTKAIAAAVEKRRMDEERAQAAASAVATGQLQELFRQQEALLAGREQADKATLDAQAKYRDETASHYATLVNMFRDAEDEKAGIRQEADAGTLASQQQYLEKVKEQADKVKQAEEKKKQYIETTNNLIAEGATNAFMAMIDGSKSAAEAFKQMAASILQDLTRMIIKQMIFIALQKATGSLFGLGGGGVTPGPVPAIEKFGFRAEGQHGLGFTNSIVKKPTAFPMGLMGESGPEAIMPLKNIGGKLGVEASMSNNMGKEVHVHFDMIKIESTDAGSFMELTTRNPEAILVPVKEAIIDGDKGLISLIAEAVK